MKSITEYIGEALEISIDTRNGDKTIGAREYLSSITKKRMRDGEGTGKLVTLFRSLGFSQTTAYLVLKKNETMVFGSDFMGNGFSKFAARFKDGSVTEIMFHKGHLMEMTNTTKDGEEDTRYPSVGQVNDGPDWRDKIVDTLCRKIEDLCQ